MSTRKVEFGAVLTLVIAVAGGLVWVGALDGRLRALETSSGLERERARILQELEDSLRQWVGNIALERKVDQPATVDDSVPAARIDIPEAGASVHQSEMVRGRWQDLPSDEVLWIVVYAQEASRYFIQDRPADRQANGWWSSRVAFGRARDSSGRFDILILGMTPLEAASMGAYLQNPTLRLEGLSWLPGGVIYDRREVQRLPQ